MLVSSENFSPTIAQCRVLVITVRTKAVERFLRATFEYFGKRRLLKRSVKSAGGGFIRQSTLAGKNQKLFESQA
jgi:hypothetical protein